MADLAQLQTRLAEAENAHHDLQTGRMARVFVDQNGERVEYVSANSWRLSAYIQELKRQISALQGSTVGQPMRVYL